MAGLGLAALAALGPCQVLAEVSSRASLLSVTGEFLTGTLAAMHSDHEAITAIILNDIL
jgi:hypothetical protein